MMRDELSNFARQIWTGLRGFAKFVWKIITLEPPAPSWADIFASCWVQGVRVPKDLVFPDPISGMQRLWWPLLVSYRPTSGDDSFVFRLRAWPGQQTVQQIIKALPLIESGMEHKIWKVEPVTGDVNAIDISAGTPPSFEALSIPEQMRLCRPSDADWRIYMGWNVLGEEVHLDPHNKSALLLTGESGSGKSVLLLRLLRSWKKSGAIVHIADFKRSGDFDDLGADGCPVLGDDVDAVITMLEKARDVIDGRVVRMAELQQSNYWNYQPDARPPLYVVAIDEVQELLETSGVTKEQKQKAGHAAALLRSLVKLGRSAGVFVVLSPQKSDATAIPTNLRDQMGLRISGRQFTPEASKAALGSVPDGFRPDDTDVVPANTPGRMVMVGQGAPFVFQCAG